MAHFILQPCHLRDGIFAKTKGTAPMKLEWAEAKDKLAPSRERNALMNLRNARVGSFIGLVRDPRNPQILRNFLLLNMDRSATLEWVLKHDPSFESRLVETYRVDDVKWDASVEEFDTPEPRPSNTQGPERL